MKIDEFGASMFGLSTPIMTMVEVDRHISDAEGSNKLVELDAGLARCEESLARSPDCSQCWKEYAWLLFETKRYRSAMQAFHQSHRLGKLCVRSQIAICKCYFALDYADEAEAYCRAMIARNTNLTIEHKLLIASMLDEAGRPEIALTIMFNVARMGASNPQAALDTVYYAAKCLLPIEKIEELAMKAFLLAPTPAVFVVLLDSISQARLAGESHVPEAWFQFLRTLPNVRRPAEIEGDAIHG